MQDEKTFVRLLQKKAREQAAIEQSSPLPEWIRPVMSVVGRKYWLALLILSSLVSIPISIVLFPIVYTSVTGGS